jgi:hypothetical protein
MTRLRSIVAVRRAGASKGQGKIEHQNFPALFGRILLFTVCWGAIIVLPHASLPLHLHLNTFIHLYSAVIARRSRVKKCDMEDNVENAEIFEIFQPIIMKIDQSSREPNFAYLNIM